MSLLLSLSALALRQFAEAAMQSLAQSSTDGLLGLFRPSGVKLGEALRRSNERTWRCVELALAGESLWTYFDSGEDKALRQQVRSALGEVTISRAGPALREQALAQLRAARAAGLIPGSPDAAAVEGALSLASPNGRAVASRQALAGVGLALREAGHPALADVLDLAPADGEPLLCQVAAYFLRREVEKDEALFRNLTFARLEEQARAQQAHFAALEQMLDRHSAGLERALALLAEVKGGVLDIQAEQRRQGQQIQSLHEAVLRALQRHELAQRDLRPRDSLSIRSDEERQLVRQLVGRYRELPEEERRRMPALLHGLGKLEVAAGDFSSAQTHFQEVAGLVDDPQARGEAHASAFRAALESRRWDDALAELRKAMAIAPSRFGLFPLERYQPQRVLGAGGFGVALLCTDQYLNAPVVIKSLLEEGLDREVAKVFAEAQALRSLDHPHIIRVLDCGFGSPAERRRPYMVMDFFPGVTLEEHVEKNGPLPLPDFLKVAEAVASALEASHQKGLLHRDVKPGNVMVRKSPDGQWEVKLIDFGLALRKEASDTASVSSKTLVGSSVAGTLRYAAPEQMGELQGVTVGPHSDVYGFGKTCQFALFQHPQPTFIEWKKVPVELAELIGRCTARLPGDRPTGLAEVRQRLRELQAPPRQPPMAVPAVPVATVAAVPVPPAPPPRPPLPKPQKGGLDLARGLRDRMVRALYEIMRFSPVGEVLMMVFGGILLGLGLFATLAGVVVLSERGGAGALCLGLVMLTVGGSLLYFGVASRFARRNGGLDEFDDVCGEAPDLFPKVPRPATGLQSEAEKVEYGWALVRFLEKQARLPSGEVRLYAPEATFTLFAYPYNVYLDGALAGSGSYEKGMDLTVTTPAGPHVLVIRQVNANDSNWYPVHLINLPDDANLHVEFPSWMFKQNATPQVSIRYD